MPQANATLPFCKSQGKLRRSPQLVSIWRALGSNSRQKVRLFVPLRSLVKLMRNLTRSQVEPQLKIYALYMTRDNLPFCLLDKCDLALRKSQGKLRRSPQCETIWRVLGSNSRQKVRLFVPLRSLVKLTRS